MKKLLKKLIPYRVVYYFRKIIMPVIHSGNQLICPVCNSHFNKFGTFTWNNINRKNAECFVCKSTERYRVLWKYLVDRTDLFNGAEKQLLHFAPERGFYKNLSARSDIKYVPCDLFPETYSYFAKRIKLLKVDITNIPFDDNSFDVILCNHVLEHVPNDASAMSEIYRVMKKGAWAILNVPVDYDRETTYEDFSITLPEERAVAFGQYDHVRQYGRDYKAKLQSTGFEVLADDYVSTLPAEDIRKFGLNSTELIYFCRKI